MTILLLTIAYILTGILFQLIIGRRNEEYFDGQAILIMTTGWPLCMFVMLVDNLDMMNRRGN